MRIILTAFLLVGAGQEKGLAEKYPGDAGMVVRVRADLLLHRAEPGDPPVGGRQELDDPARLGPPRLRPGERDLRRELLQPLVRALGEEEKQREHPHILWTARRARIRSTA
jgi:hypothetical protein